MLKDNDYRTNEKLFIEYYVNLQEITVYSALCQLIKILCTEESYLILMFINHCSSTVSNSSVKLRLLSPVDSHSQQQNTKGKFSNQLPKPTYQTIFKFFYYY